jgi:cytochrome c oxidase subunit 3/cytochrome o ubiquinol oxidase subunit 3
LTPAKVGMLAFLVSEVAFFSTLLMTYAFYLNQIRTSSPSPAVLTWTLVIPGTICLLLSSATVHFAEAALHKDNRSLFLLLWGATISLGIAFLVLTGLEWKELIGQGLTISRNMFGTCFFTLVGFHAAHVTLGVVMLSVVLGMVWSGRINAHNATAPLLVSWYWHFVDVVWIVVFTLVYVIGR